MQYDRTPKSDASGQEAGVSRRSLLTMSGAALITAGCDDEGGGGSRKETPRASGDGSSGSAGRGTAGPSGVLGANFNEDPSDIRFSELEALSASWLRGFVLMSDIDTVAPEQKEAIETLLKANKQGYGTILSLKFSYPDREFPKADNPAMTAELERVEKVARVTMGKTDILVIGNEPFIESKPEERGAALNEFYEHIARHLIAYRKREFGSHCRTRIYMGALNFLDNPKKVTQATERWMKFAQDTREIEGVDIHPHVSSIEGGSENYLTYIIPRLRGDQKFLVTEFSLVIHWRDHMQDRIPARFAKKYGAEPNMRVWQLVKEAAADPFPQKKWDDFLSMSSWYAQRKHFLRNQMKRFRETGKLAVATYGVVQADAMVKDIGPKKQPWLFNSLYANKVVEGQTDGTRGRNQAWFNDFRALQRKQDRRPVRTGETAT